MFCRAMYIFGTLPRWRLAMMLRTCLDKWVSVSGKVLCGTRHLKGVAGSLRDCLPCMDQALRYHLRQIGRSMFVKMHLIQSKISSFPRCLDGCMRLITT